MRLKRRSDPKARALETCLQGIQGGMGVERVLSAYARWADELRPLLWTASMAGTHNADLEIPQAAQQHSQAAFLQISQRMLPAPERPFLRSILRLLLVVAILAGVLVAAAIGMQRSSAAALPGEALYSVKLASERLALAWPSSPASVLALQLAQDTERLLELETLRQRAQVAQVSFSGVLESMQGDQWQVGGRPVMITGDSQIIGDMEIGFYIVVHGQLQSDGQITAQRLQMREYVVQGKIESISGEALLLGDQIISLSLQTLVQGLPEPGSRGRVILRRAQDGRFVARLVEILP